MADKKQPVAPAQPSSQQPTIEVDDAATTGPTPDIRMVLRTPPATLLATLSKDGKTITIDDRKEKAKKAFAHLNETGSASITLFNAEGALVTEEGKGETAVHAAEISPRGSFFVTWTKPHELILRRASGEREALVKLMHKKPPSGEPLIQFNKSESFACYQTTNEIRVWDTRRLAEKKEPQENPETFINLAQPWKIRAEGLVSYSICPDIGGEPGDDRPAVVAAFQAGKSGMPSTVSLYVGETRIAFATTFRADYCTFKWSPMAPGDVLAKLETSVDATGQSYYGESKLILLSATRKESLDVVCGKEGAVHDFAWSPRRHCFVVVAGKSPALCTLYDGKTADSIFKFGESHKNIACFSPSGRFLCLAGFGNLAGGMDFWDVKRNKLIGSGKADAAVGYGWSPCGRMFMTATLMPRMNVDNGVTMYSYRGEKLSHFRADDAKSPLGADGLLECRFLPVPDKAFPDLPASPVGGDAPSGATAKGTATQISVAPPPKKDVYRPPGAAMGIVGAPKSTAKPAQSNKTAAPAQQQPAKAQQQAAAVKKAEPAKEEEAEEDADPEKQLRKYKKLLRQVEDIEKSGGPKDENQRQKLGRRKEFEAKIKKLEASGVKSG